MDLLDRLRSAFGRVGEWAKRTLTLNDPALRNIFADAQTFSGITVNEHTATKFAAVWAAVRVLSEDAATIPLLLYRRLEGGGKERAFDRKLYRLLHDEPNPEMSSVSFREALMGHVLLWGNAYAEIERNGLNDPVALWPLPPDRVVPERTQGTKRLIYRVKQMDGSDRILTPNETLHIPGLSFDGIKGYSVIAKARESLGVAMAAERFAATFFGKGGRPGIVLEHPNTLSTPAIERLRTQWEETYGGPNQSNKIALLEEGLKLHDFGIPQRDMQFLEQRKFGVTEVARWFRVPPHKIMDLERATFSNIEQQDIDYFKSSLRPWLVRFEQEYNRKLIPALERNRFFFEHLEDALLRGDALTRAQALQTQFQNGALNPDEWREIENRNPLPKGEGKTYFVQGALLPIEEAKKPKPDAALRPLVLPEPDDDEEDDDEDERSREIQMVREALARVEVLAAEIRATVMKPANGATNPEPKKQEPEPVAAPVPESIPDPLPPVEDPRHAVQRGLFVDALGRMVRREIKAVRKRLRRSNGREELLAWAEGYYAKHAELVRESIRPAVVARLVDLGNGGNATDEAQGLSDRYVAEALTQLRGADDIEAVLIQWEGHRAEDVADAIVGGTH